MGNNFPGYVPNMTMWISLQVVNRHSAVRIKNLGTNIGKGMTDDLAFEALATVRRESDNPTNGYTLAEPWKATSRPVSLPITATETGTACESPRAGLAPPKPHEGHGTYDCFETGVAGAFNVRRICSNGVISLLIRL